MKKLNLTALTAAVLMAGSLFASGTATALSTTAADVTAGTVCKAYSSSSEGSLKPDWSTLKASANTWVHCPGEGAGDAADYDINLEIPVDALTDVYNCYVAAQKIASTGTSNRSVTWEAGSDAGPATVNVAVAYPTGAAAATASITAGCYLGAKHMLHSVVANS